MKKIFRFVVVAAEYLILLSLSRTTLPLIFFFLAERPTTPPFQYVRSFYDTITETPR